MKSARGACPIRLKKMRGLREVARVLARRNVVIKENARCFSTELSDVQAANGAPPVRPGRKVIIYTPSKTPMQSGNSQTVAGKES